MKNRVKNFSNDVNDKKMYCTFYIIENFKFDYCDCER